MNRAQAVAELTAPGMPYELVEITALGRKVRAFANAPRSLREMFEATASELPFLIYQDERLTFAQAWAAAGRIGHVLVHEYGVRPGDRVAIAMRNYPEWMLAFCAITSIGAIAVAMNGHWQTDELLYGLQDSGAGIVFADAERLARLDPPTVHAALPDLQRIAVRTNELPTQTRALASLTQALGDVAMPAASIEPDDFATILYTSGSTGHPKGVLSTHRNLLSALLSWELDRQIAERVAGITPPPPAEQPGTLLAVPLFHVSGLHASYLASYRAQRRIVCMYRWDPELAAQLIERERLTSMVAPAAMTGDLVRVAQEGRYSLATLQSLGGGGASRAPAQVQQMARNLPHTIPGNAWGMTETNSIGTSLSGADYLARLTSAGRCSQVLELRIVDDNGQTLPPGQSGELLVRGTSMFARYWNRPDANAASFVDGDWFRTGDVAYLDDEGFLYIVDRIKELIIRGGENIGCGQVEAALLLHPDVLEASVYAVPDERLGEEVGATLYSQRPIDEAELRAFLAQHLARFEIPRYIRFTDAPLPRTATGKILRRKIREAALGQQHSASG